MNHRIHRKSAVFVAVVFLLVLVGLYGAARILEDRVLHANPSTVPEFHSRTVTRDGIDYYPRMDLKVILLMGIDREAPSPNSIGAADSAMLLLIDERDKSWVLLQIDRDTMVELNDGTIPGSLAQAYACGTTPEEGCIHTRSAVSALLGGIPIDYYVAGSRETATIVQETITDPDGAGDAFDVLKAAWPEMEQALETDCPLTTLISLAGRWRDYRFGGVITPEGEYTVGAMGEGFYADEEKLDDLVIKLFYAPKPVQ